MNAPKEPLDPVTLIFWMIYGIAFACVLTNAQTV